MIKKRFSVFLSNVGTCSDRYCSQYATPFGIRELFQRAASIKELGGIDLVGTWNISPATAKEVADYIKDSGLTLVSIAPDLFASPEWGKGSLSSVDPKIRQAALDQIRQTMDLTAELGCSLLTIWPGQDGFDYPFQADYLTERDWFAEGIAKACAHNPKMKIAMEYKIKEPRTHSYLSSVATALLLIQEVGAANLGVALDYGHALMGYENGAESVALLKRHGDRLFHVHINDNYRHWDDDLIVGSVHTIEFLEFFHWLDRTGYDGWLTIDQFPYREDGRDAVAESAAWMSALMDTAEKMDRKELDEVLANKSAVQGSRLLRKTLLGRA